MELKITKICANCGWKIKKEDGVIIDGFIFCDESCAEEFIDENNDD